MKKEDMLRRGPIHIGEAINQTLELVEKDQNPFSGIPSGFIVLDRITHGWQPGELIVIAARPAVGKTAFALSIARNTAVDFNIPVAYFSLEMSVASLTKRLIVSESGIGFEKIRGAEKLEACDWYQMESYLAKLVSAPLYIDDSCALTTDEFMGRVKELVAQHSVRMIVVDYIHLMRAWDHSKTSKEENDEILLCLKEAALKYRVAIIAITYLRRPVRKNYSGPILTDLDAFCPAAVDYSDKIILLHRPSFLSLDSSENKMDLLHLELAKNNTGDVASMDLFLDMESGRVMERRSIYDDDTECLPESLIEL